MNTLIEKLKNSRLFTLAEKLAISSNLENYSQDDLDQLEKVLNDYDQTTKTLDNRYYSKIIETLDSINRKYKDPSISSAVDQTKRGMKKFLEATQNTPTG